MKTTEAVISLIGVDREELRWLRTLVSLLRHPDPSVPELARQALLYLTGAAEQKNSEYELREEAHCPNLNLVS